MELSSSSDELDGRTRLPVRLVLDTAWTPLSPGVRRRDVTSRHLLYQAEGLFLDLRIEREPRGVRTVLVGQLADLNDPLRPVPPSRVLLLSEGKVLVSTDTNRLGEFQMTLEPRRAMRLCLPLPGERLVEVPIDRRMTERPGDAEEEGTA
jgi:hypothetical protein